MEDGPMVKQVIAMVVMLLSYHLEAKKCEKLIAEQVHDVLTE